MKNSTFFIFMLGVLLTISACGVSKYQSNSKPVNHQIWDSLLQKHVTEKGWVNYKGFIQDSVLFNKYLTILGNNHPNDKHWSKDERLAYWINAYNAFTVKLIVDYYPVASIKDIKNGIPFVNTVWDIKFIEIEGAKYDLNNIEHGIIRDRFNEPRIHFAVNCASFSCPRLRNEAFVAERLDEQLADNTRYFLANQDKNQIEGNSIKLSKILKWYGGDFKGAPYHGIRGLLKKYGPEFEEGAEIEFLDYNWELNEQK